MIKELYTYTGVLVSAPDNHYAPPQRQFIIPEDVVEQIMFIRRTNAETNLAFVTTVINDKDNVAIVIKRFGLSVHINTGRGDVVYDLIPEGM